MCYLFSPESLIPGGRVGVEPLDSVMALTRIGDCWSSIRGLLEAHSTKTIKEILGKAGLPIFKIEYSGMGFGFIRSSWFIFSARRSLTAWFGACRRLNRSCC